MLNFMSRPLALATAVAGGAGVLIGNVFGMSVTGVLAGAAAGGIAAGVYWLPTLYHRPARELAREPAEYMAPAAPRIGDGITMGYPEGTLPERREDGIHRSSASLPMWRNQR